VCSVICTPGNGSATTRQPHEGPRPGPTGGTQMGSVSATRASGGVMQLASRKHHARAQRLDEI